MNMRSPKEFENVWYAHLRKLHLLKFSVPVEDVAIISDCMEQLKEIADRGTKKLLEEARNKYAK